MKIIIKVNSTGRNFHPDLKSMKELVSWVKKLYTSSSDVFLEFTLAVTYLVDTETGYEIPKEATSVDIVSNDNLGFATNYSELTPMISDVVAAFLSRSDQHWGVRPPVVIKIHCGNRDTTLFRSIFGRMEVEK